jgi:membrane protein involved in colicin uptake
VNLPNDGPEQGRCGQRDRDRPAAADDTGAAARAAARRRLDEVFGSLPETTSDEREPGGTSPGADRGAEAWYRENRPPHHDRDA